MTVVGTRPELIRLSSTIKKLDDSPSIEHLLVHTGQNYDYELNEVFFEDLEIPRPHYFLEAALSNATSTIGNILLKIDPVLEQESPDALLVLGDTNSCLCAIAAKKRKIPIFHMEAGNRCFDQRVPEEINRKIVDHIADINLTYSSISRQYLINEGIAPDRIIKIGSPMLEVIQDQMKKIEASKILNKLGLRPREYFVLSAHREENINSEPRFRELVDSIQSIDRKYGLPIIFSTHPRTKKRLEETKTHFSEMVRILPPMGFSDYISLQQQAKAVLSDSGTISEETSLLKLRALNIRETHERPEAMEEGTVAMVGLNSQRILNALEHVEDIDGKHIVGDYNCNNTSDKVLTILLSYTAYINRVVWGL